MKQAGMDPRQNLWLIAEDSAIDPRILNELPLPDEAHEKAQRCGEHEQPERDFERASQ
jgi:hypothetical protein